MTILENWQKWTSFLGQNVMQAESSGMPKKNDSTSSYANRRLFGDKCRS